MYGVMLTIVGNGASTVRPAASIGRYTLALITLPSLIVIGTSQSTCTPGYSGGASAVAVHAAASASSFGVACATGTAMLGTVIAAVTAIAPANHRAECIVTTPTTPSVRH